MGIKRWCESCEFYKILNPHHIIKGIPFKSCSCGEHPDELNHFKQTVDNRKEINYNRREDE